MTASGVFRLGGVADGTTLALTDLPALPETPGTTAPAGATAAPVLERGPRVAHRTPLRVWLRTADATAPATVTLRLLDPLGRAVERTVTVPGFVPTPAYSLTVVRTSTTPTGVLLAVGCDAPTGAAAGIVLAVQGISRRFDPLPWPRPRPRPSKVTGQFPLATIATGKLTFPADGRVHVVRPLRAPLWPREARYAVFVPLVSPVEVTLALLGPGGEQLVTVTAAL
ncbi:MAG: hypothetical protein IPH27_00210 [Actinomycetales bacterium]|nr:hypothetical protein [Candidatus Phosphoribacter baldrii]